jgi:branched-chain amino acid transport system substrate-binding protein
VTPRTARLLGALAVPVLLLTAACGGSDDQTASGEPGAASGKPITVGVVTSTSGPLASYGAAYLDGLKAGLADATKGTNAVEGRPVTLEVVDDGGDPAKAVTAATDLAGRGVKVLVGTASSGVAVKLAPFAQENDLLYISGPAASDAITGVNKNTFRSGRQTYQDVATAATLLEGGASKVLVLAQDTEFGKGNVAAVKAVLGAKGATVDQLLAPATTNEFTPFAQQVKDKAPDLLFVAWAGDTTSAMWQSLQQQGVLASTTVTTGLGDRASWAAYGTDPKDIRFLAHYVPGAGDTAASKALAAAVPQPDLFTPDGFVAGQMVVRALSEGSPDDTASMITALEGWSFDAPKGRQTVRASDHAMLQPMFTASLTGAAGSRAGQVLSTLTPEAVAPPEKAA